MNIEKNSTNEKIVEATFEILREEGVSKATTKKIAAKAGVNEVTIFRNFKNKQNLIDATKEYYLQKFMDELANIFDFTDDVEIGDYLHDNFQELSNLSEKDFSILKIAMEEVHEIPEKKLLISSINEVVLTKLEEFFTLQIEKGKIRDVDARVLAVMCFGITFQSLVLWKVYDGSSSIDTEDYSQKFLDMLYHGIKP
ncbi:TetR/AcrR family transcriptional regulator [Methanobrevibacter sp.]|uniref:TetR/AcrR family transcriptional regulator n=1 Tax=Methanobrevibacter sp. TaxID=66852 RepID=UPI003975DD6F